MTLIKSKRYPEYDTYTGYIHHSTVEYKTARFPGLDSFASRVISEAVEAEMNKVGGRLLEVAIYSDKSWWGIIPIYILTTEFKWYLPGEISFGNSELVVPAVIASIMWAIAAILAVIAIIYYTNKYYDTVEKYGYPAWYNSLFGSIALLVVVGAGAYLVIKYAPAIYKKIYK